MCNTFLEQRILKNIVSIIFIIFTTAGIKYNQANFSIANFDVIYEVYYYYYFSYFVLADNNYSCKYTFTNILKIQTYFL